MKKIKVRADQQEIMKMNDVGKKEKAQIKNPRKLSISQIKIHNNLKLAVYGESAS